MKNTKAFIFDWDGTLFDSMEIKSDNFTEAFTTCCQTSKAEIKKLYLQYSGEPRKIIVSKILKDLNLSELDFEKFTALFSQLNENKLALSPLFDDTLPTLEMLKTNKKLISISSSVPQKELENIVQKKLPENFYHSLTAVMGTQENFSKGIAHVEKLVEKTGLSKNEMIFIGDDAADEILSRTAGVECVLVDRSNRLKIKNKIKNLKELEAWL